MFVQTWKKYLPVIVFLMKRSARGEQKLDMNHTDFERATGGKKIKLNFPTVTLKNGRVDYDAKHPVLVTDLIMVLQENKPAETLMQHQQFNFSMNPDCQLSITNTTEFIGS
ncbi:MAG TPA: hypothetical protein VFP97_17700 [Chitinophagaceae bacterium]|nr:hypothetical protein [Chitinophagaceae bacterium]